MKKYNIISRVLFVILAIFMGVACQDDFADADELRDSNYKNKQSTTAPSITSFYEQTAYAASGDSAEVLTKAELGTYVVIVGENLEGLTCLSFNSDTIDLKEVYDQWDMIVFQVPESLPSDITNDITCTTDFGSTTATLGLELPAAEFTSLENEFIEQGTKSVKIMGANFSIYGFTTDRSSVVLYNEAEGYEETIPVTWADDSYLVIDIPADAPDNSLFKFILDGEEDAQKLHYRPTDWLMFGNTELTNNVSIPSGLTIDYTDGTGAGEPRCLIPSLNGGDPVKYFRVQGTLAAWQIIIQVYLPEEFLAFEMPADKSGADYDLVYEVWTNAIIPIPSGTTYKCQLTDAGLQGMWDNFGVNEINTGGEWVTYRVNLSTILGTTEGSATAFKDKLIIKTAIAIAEADHAFANFRVQPAMP